MIICLHQVLSSIPVWYWTNPGSNIPQNSSSMATYLPSLKSSKSDNQGMQDTVGGVRKNSCDILLWTPSHRQAGVGWPNNNSSVWTQDVIQRTCQMWWTIELNRESGKSMLAAWHNDIIWTLLYGFKKSRLI